MLWRSELKDERIQSAVTISPLERASDAAEIPTPWPIEPYFRPPIWGSFQMDTGRRQASASEATFHDRGNSVGRDARGSQG
jgi:hypothetical protein